MFYIRNFPEIRYKIFYLGIKYFFYLRIIIIYVCFYQFLFTKYKFYQFHVPINKIISYNHYKIIEKIILTNITYSVV